jgi:3-phenylpropionate/trans-cinnamate dioxygenase ferredoxin component
MPKWVRVADVSECPAGALTGVLAEDVPVVLANVDGKVCALLDQCSHEEYPLSDGDLEGGDIVCTYHGARFDACTGARKALPAVLDVRSFPVEIRDGEVYVDID